MPTAPSAIPYDQRHLWALSFDRVVCRTCDAELSDENAEDPCKGAKKVRPIAAFRQQQEGRA